MPLSNDSMGACWIGGLLYCCSSLIFSPWVLKIYLMWNLLGAKIFWMLLGIKDSPLDGYCLVFSPRFAALVASRQKSW